MPLNLTDRIGAWLDASGCFFRVWAPTAQAVAVLIQDGPYWETVDVITRKELTKQDGYWSGTVPGVNPWQLYRYEITPAAGAAFETTDPAARDVISSDLTRSDPSKRNGSIIQGDWAVPWSPLQTPRFRDFLIYELHVGSFAGRNDGLNKAWSSFEDVEGKLSYIRDLGFNCIELLPVHEYAMDRSWGYNPASFFAPESSYGSPYSLAHLVDEAHRRGLAVVFDVVYNTEFPDRYFIAEHLPDNHWIVKTGGFRATWDADSHHECQRALAGQDPLNRVKGFLGWDGYDHAWNLVKYTLGSHDDIGDDKKGNAEDGLTNWDKRHRYFGVRPVAPVVDVWSGTGVSRPAVSLRPGPLDRGPHPAARGHAATRTPKMEPLSLLDRRAVRLADPVVLAEIVVPEELARRPVPVEHREAKLGRRAVDVELRGPELPDLRPWTHEDIAAGVRPGEGTERVMEAEAAVGRQPDPHVLHERKVVDQDLPLEPRGREDEPAPGLDALPGRGDVQDYVPADDRQFEVEAVVQSPIVVERGDPAGLVADREPNGLLVDGPAEDVVVAAVGRERQRGPFPVGPVGRVEDRHVLREGDVLDLHRDRGEGPGEAAPREELPPREFQPDRPVHWAHPPERGGGRTEPRQPQKQYGHRSGRSRSGLAVSCGEDGPSRAHRCTSAGSCPGTAASRAVRTTRPAKPGHKSTAGSGDAGSWKFSGNPIPV
ncbi:MAG: alpha-amylase family glycosyl hydrolase [Isosphaeraceae bacterium]